MKQTMFRAALAATLACLSLTAAADVIIHYKNIPVTIELHDGEERSIRFGDHVSVGVTRGQQVKNLFRVQSAQGVVHFLANQEFDKQRVQVKRMSDGRVILLDLISASKNTTSGPLENIRIVLESENQVPSDELSAQSYDPFVPEKVITPVDLTRFAAQRLYGPTRLHRSLPGINEMNPGVKGGIHIFKGANKYRTFSQPILVYQGGGYYLAAIHIKNTSNEFVHLDYLELNVQFSHATFQHHSLYSNGTPGDSTVLYLISDKPLNETLYPWTYYQDLTNTESMAR